ncbi:Predicted aminopeptidase [Catalinimonas alkaloidigena]|uniref:Predicted aminopeptidase n=1 Tax=Catalinimonas alkaloidigena TaxID=1075417 RepID=A0A1G8ZML2_9BACT|nr:aminopeptidase [Catalinimonas alkaloidigena]SDK16291.1 Predicted aminopeptidase [Catalinimonas alkaloidigena]
MVKKILALVGIVFLGFVLFYASDLAYGFGQLRGQLHIVWNARPIEEFLADETFPDSLKARIRLVQEIRRYAIDSLGINDSKNYTTLYDQHGKPVLWNLTGCRPFALEAKEWSFPFLGTFPYIGFFDREKVLAEEARLQDEGYETYIYSVGGWSTLGWFRDPILSSMLRRPEGDLAELIIHELTHATLYVKDNIQYNENLATFVGEEGAKRFLAWKYGEASAPYQHYLYGDDDYERYSRHILRGANRLDSLYRTFSDAVPLDEKKAKKQALIGEIIAQIDTISFRYPALYQRRFSADSLPNNTYFMSYKRYREEQNQFETEFYRDFDGDFQRYLQALKKRYPSL